MTEQKTRAYVEIIAAVLDTVRKLGSTPHGHMYAHLMGHLSLDQLNAILRIGADAGLLRVDGSHMIHWTGAHGDEIPASSMAAATKSEGRAQ